MSDEKLSKELEARIDDDIRAITREMVLAGKLNLNREWELEIPAAPAPTQTDYHCGVCASLGLNPSHPPGETRTVVMTSPYVASKESQTPVALGLWCPKCGTRHFDRGEWATRLHKTHLCESCGNEWRPYEYPTVGVADSAAKK